MLPPPLPPEITNQMPPDPRLRIIDELAVFLADWPLYRPYRYEGDLWPQYSPYNFGFPATIKLHCPAEDCERTQIWDRLSGPDLGNKGSSKDMFASVDFKCRNCQRSQIFYFLRFNVSQARGEITKVGQWPPLSREPDSTVTGNWDKADKLFYRDAMTFRHFNKGIAALPYLRRIIENHIQDVLFLIADANERKPIFGFDLSALENAKSSHRFSDKLKFTEKYLPTGLIPDGCANPIANLYDLVSDGLHQRTEEECVDIFDRGRIAFEYVVKKLTEAKREDEAYIKAVHKLAKH